MKLHANAALSLTHRRRMVRLGTEVLEAARQASPRA